jgi:hypothetical protein
MFPGPTAFDGRDNGLGRPVFCGHDSLQLASRQVLLDRANLGTGKPCLTVLLPARQVVRMGPRWMSIASWLAILTRAVLRVLPCIAGSQVGRIDAPTVRPARALVQHIRQVRRRLAQDRDKGKAVSRDTLPTYRELAIPVARQLALPSPARIDTTRRVYCTPESRIYWLQFPLLVANTRAEQAASFQHAIQTRRECQAACLAGARRSKLTKSHANSHLYTIILNDSALYYTRSA